jgi:hypothetical protein
LNRYIGAHPQEPLPYAVRAAAYLFFELDRLGILESQFLISDKRIADKKSSGRIRTCARSFCRRSEDAQSRATAALAANPNDRRRCLPCPSWKASQRITWRWLKSTRLPVFPPPSAPTITRSSF